MLPAAHRLTSGSDIRRTVRSGRRGSGETLVVHAMSWSDPGSDITVTHPARAAFVVGKKVGPSVVRHRVQRRLRHLMRPRIAALPPGTDLVVRAQASAAHASSAQLAVDLDRALRKAGLA